MREAALAYVAMGYSVLPLHSIGPDGWCTCGWYDCGSPGKHPRTARGVKDASSDPEVARRWWQRWPTANVGVAIPKGCIVLDVDSEEGLQEALSLGLTDNIPACRTARGWHYWLSAPPGMEPRSTVGLAPGLDVRACGSYVVAPPSVHRTGVQYTWEVPLVPPHELPMAPPRLLDLLQQSRPPANRDGQRDRAAQLDPEARERIRDAARECWEEGTRHDTALYLAGALYKRGVPLQEAEGIIREAAATATDGELEDRLRAVRDTYAKDTSEVAGWSRLPQPLREALDTAGAIEPERVYRHAMHLRELFQGRFLWVSELKTWLLWDGIRWAPTPPEVVCTQAVEELQQYYVAKLLESKTSGERAAWSKRLADLHGTKHVEDALQLLKGYPEIIMHPAALDNDAYKLNTPSGVLCLRSLTLKQHSPEYMCTKVTRARYNPTAQCPRWERFLREIFQNDEDLIEYVQQAVGLALLGENRHNIIYILFGRGANGKSTLLKTLQFVFGDYCRSIPRDALLSRKHQQDASRTALASLVGTRLGILEELSDDSVVSATAIKDLVSGSTLAVRGLYQNYFQATLSINAFIACNNRPSVSDFSEGAWRRIRLVPFSYTVPPERRDPELVSKLVTEADGILRWAVDGLRKYWERGLFEPRVVVQATTEYRSEADRLQDFINECCDLDPRALTPTGELYSSYKKWALGEGDSEHELLSDRAFAQLLTRKGFPTARGTTAARTRLRRGIRLRQSGGSEPEKMDDVDDLDAISKKSY